MIFSESMKHLTNEAVKQLGYEYCFRTEMIYFRFLMITSMTEMQIDWEKLKTLKTSASNRTSMLDILGISRREIYITKAYEYFLNPHRGFPYFKEFAKIFFEEIGEVANGFLDDYAVYSEYVLLEEKEEQVKDKKQIDLVIFSRGKAIVVENKIDASLYNDLDEYEERLKRKLGLEQVSTKVLSFHSSQGMTHASICKRAKLEIIDKNQDSENQLHLFQFSEFIEHMIKLSNAMGTQEDFDIYTAHIKEINNAVLLRDRAYSFVHSKLAELRTKILSMHLPKEGSHRISDYFKDKDARWMHLYTNPNNNLNSPYLTIVYEHFLRTGGARPITLIIESKVLDDKELEGYFKNKFELQPAERRNVYWRHYYFKNIQCPKEGADENFIDSKLFDTVNQLYDLLLKFRSK